MKYGTTKRGMHYRCDNCGFETVMWLERGLEEHNGKDHKPVPFIIMCPKCCSVFDGMRHVNWNEDIYLPGYRPLAEHMNRFEYVENEECGIPVFPNDPVVVTVQSNVDLLGGGDDAKR